MSKATPRTPIVLVHGWAGSRESWWPVVEELAESLPGSDAVRVALPGSPGYEGSHPANVAGAVAAVRDVTDQLETPALLVGHSMGGQVTALVNAQAAGSVAAEVVIEPAYGAADSERVSIEQWADRIASHGHQELEEFFRGAVGSRASRDVELRVMADLHSTPLEAIGSYLRSEYLDADAIGLISSTRKAAARRVRPVLAIYGSHDAAIRGAALRAPSGSRVEVWDGASHFLHLEDPTRFALSLRRWMTLVAELSPDPSTPRSEQSESQRRQ